MKKRLEAELISIAHRILKLKNKSEIDQLYHETQKLYEALTVLKFYGDNYEQVKADVVAEDLEVKVAAFIEDKKPIHETTKEKSTVETKSEIIENEVEIANIETKDTTNEEDITESEMEEPPIIIGEITIEEEEIEDKSIVASAVDLDFEPIFELAAEAPIEANVEEKITPSKTEAKQISFDDLLGDNYTEPVFVKPNDIVVPPSLKNMIDEKPLSLNDEHLKTINIGLNDKIAFVKHLFSDSTEDYNRVLSQLNTFSTFEEAKDFIDEIIKPDYNNWDGVDDYAERFIEIVAKKFS